MKKIAFVLALFGLLLGTMGCSSSSKASKTSNFSVNSDQWISYEVKPSEITYTGETIMYSIPEYDGLRAAVFYDYISKEDGRFYYEKWYYDHGWEQTPDGEGWRRARYEYERPIRGTMYIHPRRRVAIYFFPGGTYDVFSVRFEKDEE